MTTVPRDSFLPAAARALCVTALAALTVSLGACGGDSRAGSAPPPPAAVGVITLAPESLPVSTELPGRTSAFLSAEIRPQVGGIVQKRLFTEGSRVKAGQVLYQIDAASYQATLAATQAQLAKARANLGTAQTNAARNAALIKSDAISRQQYDDSQAAVLLAQSDVAVAEAAVQTARINLDYTQVKSPIAGRSTLSSVTPGALVTANQAAVLTTVTQIDPIYVDITQSSTELLRLKADLAAGRFARDAKGQTRVTIKLDDGSSYAHPGRLEFTGVQVNPGTGAVTLRAVLPNPDGLLMPGMYVRAELEAGVNAQALLVPQQAVSRDPAGNASVLLVGQGDKLEKRRIVTGVADGNRWEVLSGLTAGEHVVVDGVQHARVGQQVRPVPWKAPQAAAKTQPDNQNAH